MRRLFIFSVMVLVVGGCGLVFGAAGGFPAVTEKTIQGLWDGIYDEEPRIFIMQVQHKNDCRIAMAAGPPDALYLWRFRCVSIVVRPGGVFLVEAVSSQGSDMRMRIEGKGEASAEVPTGILRARVELLAADGIPTIFRDVVFKVRPHGYFDEIRALMKHAQDGLLSK